MFGLKEILSMACLMYFLLLQVLFCYYSRSRINALIVVGAELRFIFLPQITDQKAFGCDREYHLPEYIIH